MAQLSDISQTESAFLLFDYSIKHDNVIDFGADASLVNIGESLASLQDWLIACVVCTNDTTFSKISPLGMDVADAPLNTCLSTVSKSTLYGKAVGIGGRV